MSQKHTPVINNCHALTACAHVLADLAATESIRYFRIGAGNMGLVNKAQLSPTPGTPGPGAQGAFDPVTSADRAAETAMRAELARRFPDHGIDGEEFPATNPAATARWILDPIDGTAAFLTGFPLWGTLIGFVENGTPIIGLIDQPFTKERFWSTSEAAWHRLPDATEYKLRTRACETLSQATLTTTHPDYFAGQAALDAFATVKAAVKTTRYGGDCYAYAMLAAGHIDLIVESGLGAHDVAALIPIIEKAGGVITTWTGEPALQGGNIIAAGDARVHTEAMALLNT